jgi:hypothetical protein
MGIENIAIVVGPCSGLGCESKCWAGFDFWFASTHEMYKMLTKCGLRKRA